MFNVTLISFIIILFSSNVYAQCTKPINKEYSHKDFSSTSLRNIPSSKLNNTCIKGSNFYREKVGLIKNINEIRKEIFPDGMTGVEFVGCNLDNVYVDTDNNMVHRSSTNNVVKTQKDGMEWVLDEDLKPIRPLYKELYLEYGVSIDPKDIPSIYEREPVLIKKIKERNEIKK